MDKGQIISGAGHAGLIVWVVVGGFFSTPEDAPAVAATSVSLLSTAEYEKLAEAAPGKPATVPEIAAPEPVEPSLDPAQSPRPEAKPQPVAEPAPEPAPIPDANPDVTEIAALPEPEVVEAPEPLAPPAEVEQPVVVPQTEEAKPQDAPRVAPTPAEAPAPDAEIAETPTPAVSPDAAPDAPVVEEDQPEAAPQEATTQIVTEAVETEDAPALAPTASVRPRTKPPARAAEAPAEDATPAAAEVAADTAAEPAEDSIADAVATAVADSEPAGTGGTEADAGPPMTDGEKDALRVAVQACWNVGSLSSDALLTTVTVGVSVAQNGVPDAGSIRMIGFEGGTEAGARQSYEAARRAIIICGKNGFELPAEKYEQWKDIEMVFNPERMRIK